MAVTPATFNQAESDYLFHRVVQRAGGVNRLFHCRGVPTMTQPTRGRMPDHVLHSMAVVDTSQGATVTFPDIPADRYASIYLIDGKHDSPWVIYSPGTYILPSDIQYLGVGIHIQLFDPHNREEVDLVHWLQDQFAIEADSAEPLPDLPWDIKTLQELRSQYANQNALHRRGRNVIPRPRASVAAWGLFPEGAATDFNDHGGHTYPTPADGADRLPLKPAQSATRSAIAGSSGQRWSMAKTGP